MGNTVWLLGSLYGTDLEGIEIEIRLIVSGQITTKLSTAHGNFRKLPRCLPHRHQSIALANVFDEYFVPINAKPVYLLQLLLSFSLFSFFPQLRVHHFILVVKVFGKATSWHILDLPFEHFTNRVSHLF